MTHTTEYIKSIKCYGRNDYAAVVNNEIVGYAASAIDAKALADAYVYDLLTFTAGEVVAEEVAAPVATVAAPVANNPLQAITRESVHAVVVKAKQQVADQTRWLNALSRAEDALLSNQWIFTGTTLKIHSKSRKLTYTITGNDCSCESAANGKPCYHVAAWRILVRATQQAAA